jgi:acyl-coenzyme A synthetase/AMP-(fatty) acid ligase
VTALRVEPRQWVACLLTSGSTGAPQPQRKRWDALQLSIDAEAQSLCTLLDWPSIAGLNIVATVPPQHSYGFESSVLLALLGGAAFDAGRPFYPADIAEALARLPRPRALVTTPVHLKALLLSGASLPPVDLVLSATAPLSPQLAQQAESRLGSRLIEIYGCTEAGQIAARRTTATDVWTTLSGLRVESQLGDDGERFLVSGGHVLEPTPLADQLELIDGQHFRLLGRANDLIHVAGKRSSLAHLNFHLNRIDGVDDGVFWLPDGVADGVVRLVAFVVAPTLSARQIVAALRPRVESAFLPRRVVHVQALPRQATGKITAQALREFALRTLAKADPHQAD